MKYRVEIAKGLSVLFLVAAFAVWAFGTIRYGYYTNPPPWMFVALIGTTLLSPVSAVIAAWMEEA